MNNTIKLAIVGGTGKSGAYLVRALLSHNFHIKLLLRNPNTFNLSSPFIELIQGDARRLESIHKLVAGCDAVISTLGQPKGEPSIFSEATHNVIAVMNEHNIRRYIVTTGLHVDTPDDHKSSTVQLATEWMRTNYPKITQDKQVEYDLLVASRLDWTLVRLPLIELTDERRPTQASLTDCGGDKVSATDLADFLVAQLSDSTFIRRAPFLYNVRQSQ